MAPCTNTTGSPAPLARISSCTPLMAVRCIACNSVLCCSWGVALADGCSDAVISLQPASAAPAPVLASRRRNVRRASVLCRIDIWVCTMIFSFYSGIRGKGFLEWGQQERANLFHSLLLDFGPG